MPERQWAPDDRYDQLDPEEFTGHTLRSFLTFAAFLLASLKLSSSWRVKLLILEALFPRISFWIIRRYHGHN